MRNKLLGRLLLVLSIHTPASTSLRRFTIVDISTLPPGLLEYFRKSTHPGNLVGSKRG